MRYSKCRHFSFNPNRSAVGRDLFLRTYLRNIPKSVSPRRRGHRSFLCNIIQYPYYVRDEYPSTRKRKEEEDTATVAGCPKLVK